jgi:hypothetical protein
VRTGIRKPLFIAFLLLYVLVLPFLLTYALGYDLLAVARGRLIRTGGVFVASTPPRALLSIDDKPSTWRTPVSIISLRAGPHRVALSLEGFRPWARTVTVRPGEVTIVEDALLIPDTWQRRSISRDAYTELVPTLCGPYLLFRKGQRLRDLHVFGLREEKMAVPRVAPALNANAPILALHTVQGSSTFFIEVGPAARRRVLLARIDWPEISLRDVTRLFPAPLDRMEWEGADPEEVFVSRGGRLDVVALGSRKSRVLAAGNVGFGLAGKDVYVLDDAMSLWKLDAREGTRQPVHDFDALLAEFSGRRDVRIDLPGAGFLSLLGADGGFAAGRKEGWFTSDAVRGFQAAPWTDKVLFWQKDAMAIADLHPEVAKPAAARPAAGRSPTARTAVQIRWMGSSNPIEQAWFVYGVSHVLYRAGNDLILRAPLAGSSDLTTWIGKVRDGTNAVFSEESGRLYFIEGSTRRPTWIQIVPQPRPFEGLLMEIRTRTGNSP